jgi:exoribonuclease II
LSLSLSEPFSSDVEQAAFEVAESIVRRVGLDDRVPYPVFTLDHPDTHDFDDAISARLSGDGQYLHCRVCVSHPGPELAPGTPVFEEAQRRGASIYLPDRVVPMLPSILSDDALSLKQGCVRQALCLQFTLPSNPNLWVAPVDYSLEIHPVHVTRNVVFGESLPGDFPATLMNQWTDWRRRARISAGAVILPRVRTRPAKLSDGTVVLSVTERDDAEHRMIEELMVCFNERVADWCVRHAIPCLYRGSEPHRNPDQVARWLRHSDYALARTHVFRHAGRALTSLQPVKHHTVGVERYAQATSPVRRFSDVLVHAAIGASFRGESPLPGPAMLARFQASEAGSEAGRRLTRDEERRAFHTYYSSRSEQTVSILVPRRAVANEELDAAIADLEISVRLRTRLPAAAGDRVIARWAGDEGGKLVFEAI